MHDIIDTDCVLNDLAVVKKYGKPFGVACEIESTNWKDAHPSERRQMVYYSSVADGGYADISIPLAEHERKAHTLKVNFLRSLYPYI